MACESGFGYREQVMKPRLAFVPRPHEVSAGPTDVGSEQRWLVRLEDGRRAVVAQLSRELARDESIRRRYLRDVRRVQALEAYALAPTLEIGPEPDDPDRAPWRLRLDPEGRGLDEWLERAPLPMDEIARVGAALADAVHAVHLAGGVLRDLSPRNVVVTPDGRVVLTDVGLSRVDVLSSHTASSLLLEGSPYASPELLFRTVIDQRSDLFSLGVIFWRALTGTFPFGDEHALMREHAALPRLAELRADVPEALDVLVRRCLAREPADRPESATELAWVLRGGATTLADARDRTSCQHCGAQLHVGQRLCLACGHVATRFEHLAAGDGDGYAIELMSAREDAGYLQRLRRLLASLSSRSVQGLEFLIGDPMMYSPEERSHRIRLPARLFDDLSRETALELAERMEKQGMQVRVIEPGILRRKLWGALGVGAVVAATTAATAWLGWAVIPWLTGIGGFVATVVLLARAMTAMNDRYQPALFRLRRAPAALPASDPLVARLSALLRDDLPADARAQVAEMALLVQRAVDHRAALVPHLAAEAALLTSPLEPLIDLVERQVEQLARISEELDALDEGAMVRALAASSARGDAERERESILAGLDRLRNLEDERAHAFHRLLEASDLLRRSVTLGLEVRDPEREHERQIALALAALEPDAS